MIKIIPKNIKIKIDNTTLPKLQDNTSFIFNPVYKEAETRDQRITIIDKKKTPNDDENALF